MNFLVRFFADYQINKAAKRYAATLPAQLQKDYGASEWYTSSQINASIARAKLPMEFSAIGQAQYLPQELFDTEVESVFSYDFLRAKFKLYAPRRALSQEISRVDQNPNIVGGSGF